jgi:TolB protein
MTLLRPVSRRAFVSGAAALAAAHASRALAANDVYVHAGANFTPVNVAITSLQGDSGEAKIRAILVNDLSRSVFLSPLDPQTYPEAIANPDQKPNLDAWKTINAQFVVTGKVSRGDGGRIAAQFRLWDVASGEQVAGQQYSTDAANFRRVAHLIADAIFARVTGETGFFDSRVVFVDESGPKSNRRKRLALMDTDGANIKYLTQGDNLVVTPSFAPNQQQVAYMSFANGDPKVTLLDLETGQRTPVGQFSGMTFAPRFSPDGRNLLLSLTNGSTSNIYEMGVGGGGQTQLTDTNAIDTSPCFSPDGSQIAFESDRGGTQQLYVMAAGGGAAKRISFGAGRYSTPAWSPKGDLIAFTRQKDGLFAIGVMKVDGSGERIITEGYHNEGPTFSPNGLFVMFFRDPGGESGAKIYMADIFGHGEFVVPTPGYASDPSWGPLMK